MLYERKTYCLQACLCIFQPGNFTGLGSEGVNLLCLPALTLFLVFCIQKRLQKELQAMTKDPPPGVQVDQESCSRMLNESVPDAVSHLCVDSLW